MYVYVYTCVFWFLICFVLGLVFVVVALGFFFFFCCFALLCFVLLFCVEFAKESPVDGRTLYPKATSHQTA